jgi:hypothetical protein
MLRLAAAPLILLGLLVAAVTWTPTARAQGMLGHPMPQGPRPFHRLLAAADVVAIGTIEGEEPGRLRVVDARAIVGDPGPSFELKRAPSNAPSFPIGSRALLILRGARSPYILVDEPKENVVLTDPAAEPRFAAEVAALHAALGDPTKLRDRYLAWCDGDAEDLRNLATRGLYDAEAGFQPLPPAITEERARMAVDPTRSAGARSASAAVAVLSPGGTSRLLEGVPGAGADGDPARNAVYEIALQGAMLRSDAAGLLGAVQRGLASPDATVRRTAARYGSQVSLPEVRAAVAKLATTDPDPEVRKLAQKVAGGGS